MNSILDAVLKGADVLKFITSPPKVRFPNFWITLGQFTRLLDEICPKIVTVYGIPAHPWTPLFMWTWKQSFMARWYTMKTSQRTFLVVGAGVGMMMSAMLGPDWMKRKS